MNHRDTKDTKIAPMQVKLITQRIREPLRQRRIKKRFFRTYTVENSSSSLSAQQCSKVDKYQFNKIVLHDRFGRAKKDKRQLTDN